MSHPGYPTHPVRPEAEQSVHDQIIQALQQQLQQKGFQDVRTNPGQQKNWSMNCNSQKLWPDVFTVDQDSHITSVFEVETVSTVDAGSADQWKDYASCVRPFYLVVPESKQEEAEEILADQGILCDGILTYKG